jgi:uncharacterized delta-60 repeat protein
MKKFLFYIFIITSSTSTTNCFAQAGTLDLFFAAGGVAVTNINISGYYDDGGRSLALFPDGKFVLGGWSKNASDWDFGFAAYNSDGSLNLNFSLDGKHTIDFGNGNDFCQSVNVLPDGSVLAAGTMDAGANDQFALVKLTPLGDLDLTFGTSGIFAASFGTSNSYCYGSALQSDGKILTVGSSNFMGSFDFAMIRVNADGTIDTTFGVQGKVTTDIDFLDDWSFSVRVLPNGSILVAGYAYNGSNYDYCIVKYNSDGSLDTSFGVNGIKVIDYNTSYDIGFTMDVMPDGRFMVGGYTWTTGDKDWLVARYNADGSLDNTFDNDGWAITAVSAFDDNLYSIKIQPDGKAVAAGSSSNGSNFDIAVVRYNYDGSLDNTFGVNGKFIHDVDGGDDIAWSVKLTATNKILVGGETWGGRADYNFVVLQLNNDPVSIDEQATSEGINIYPNPFSTSLSVRGTLESGSLLTLFDYTGKQIVQQTINSAETILNTESLAAGLYFLKVENEVRIKSYKVVKQQ